MRFVFALLVLAALRPSLAVEIEGVQVPSQVQAGG